MCLQIIEKRKTSAHPGTGFRQMAGNNSMIRAAAAGRSRLRQSTFQADGGGGSLKGDKTLGLAAGFSQPCQIGLHLVVGFERLQGGIQDGGRSRVIGSLDAVVHPLAFAACVDDSGVAKISTLQQLAVQREIERIGRA
jgi:hypothetical protein